MGWEFRACCNHCHLWSDITKVVQCDDGDCVAGITSGKNPTPCYRHILTLSMLEDYRYRQDDEYLEVPGERRFNGVFSDSLTRYDDLISCVRTGDDV